MDIGTIIIMENGKVYSYELSVQTRLTIGRATSQNMPDIPLSSPIVGRKHGEFVYISGQWFYCDNGSRNGTFYNGRKIKAGLNGRVCPVLLQDGDVLRIDYADLNTPDSRGIKITFVAK